MAGPNLQFFSTAGATISTYNFGTISSGEESDILNTVLWNNKGGVLSVEDAVNVTLTARVDSASQLSDPLRQGWVYIRSAGIENPNDVDNFLDDNQSVYTQITEFNNLLIGNIPDGCGRHIYVKLIVPPTAPTQIGVSVRLIAGTGQQSYPLPYFFNRAFGDGIVDNLVSQTFPSILQQKIGVWDDVELLTGGQYTGLVAKDYFVKIVSGTTIGHLTYSTSDDNGVTYGTPITSSTTSFTEVTTSNDEDEGVTLKFVSSAGQSLSVGDLWKIPVSTSPFAFVAGISTALEGYIGFGEALVYNNRVFHQSPTYVSGLTTNDITYAFLQFDGNIDTSQSANPQIGKLLIGWFETDSTKVINVYSIRTRATLGLDLFDDFSILYPNIAGLTLVYYRGKYKYFNEVVQLPISGLPYGTITLLPSVTNYVQVDTINQEIVTYSTGYFVNNLPLFRIGTDSVNINSIEDDRTRISVTTINRSFVSTVSNISNNTSQTFSFSNFANVADVKKLVVTPTVASGTYQLYFYENESYSTLEYEAAGLSNVFTDPVPWPHLDQSQSKKIFGRISSFTGATTTYTFDFRLQILG